MDARAIARSQALGRIALGGSLTVAPRFVGRQWVGKVADRPGGQALAVGLGTRDAGLGLGTLAALRAGRGAAPWIRAGILADAADAVATLRARQALPPLVGPAVAALAAGSALLGVWLQLAVE